MVMKLPVFEMKTPEKRGVEELFMGYTSAP